MCDNVIQASYLTPGTSSLEQYVTEVDASGTIIGVYPAPRHIATTHENNFLEEPTDA